jgi:methionyl-tRNA formyltransferase
VRADAGGIVAAQAVPILGDDTAFEVFRKVSVAAELTLARALPELLAGTAVLRPQDLAQGSYFGRRTHADGAIHWQLGAVAVHNLVRAVAPPYPGAFAEAAGLPLRVLRTLRAEAPRAARPELRMVDGEVRAACADGALRLLEFELDGQVRDAAAFHARFGAAALPLTDGRRN